MGGWPPPPARAPPAVPSVDDAPVTITTIAPVYAPVEKPITSGEPSGLRVSDWKIAPETPSAAPKTEM